MINPFNQPAGDRFGLTFKADAHSHHDGETSNLELWHSKLVHVEDILNFDDYVEDGELKDPGNENIHFMI